MRRNLAIGLAALICAALAGSAAAAPASGGRHLPHFSLMNERVAIKKLPIGMRLSFQRVHGFGLGHPKIRGPVWFGEVKRPGSTVIAAGVKSWVCVSVEHPKPSGNGSGSGTCTDLAAARELQMLSISESCSGNHVHARVAGLVPDGVTGLALEKEDGTIRTVPVVDNTVAFPVGDESIVLHGVGDAAAEELEWRLPLGGLGKPGKSKDRRGSACIGVGFGTVTVTEGTPPAK